MRGHDCKLHAVNKVYNRQLLKQNILTLTTPNNILNFVEQGVKQNRFCFTPTFWLIAFH